jgi:hypothetical protein
MIDGYGGGSHDRIRSSRLRPCCVRASARDANARGVVDLVADGLCCPRWMAVPATGEIDNTTCFVYTVVRIALAHWQSDDALCNCVEWSHELLQSSARPEKRGPGLKICRRAVGFCAPAAR